MHRQVTHLSTLEQYRSRFHYRISKLSSDQMILLTSLMKSISVDTRPAPTAHSILRSRSPIKIPSATPKSALTLGIPAMFLDQGAANVEIPTTPLKQPRVGQDHAWKRIPSIFGNDALLKEACMAPALPAARGAIKKQMTKVKAIKAEVSRGQLFIERSFKKPTRTTLRIREGSHGPKNVC